MKTLSLELTKTPEEMAHKQVVFVDNEVSSVSKQQKDSHLSNISHINTTNTLNLPINENAREGALGMSTFSNMKLFEPDGELEHSVFKALGCEGRNIEEIENSLSLSEENQISYGRFGVIYHIQTTDSDGNIEKEFIVKSITPEDDEATKETAMEIQVMEYLKNRTFKLHPYRYVTLLDEDKCFYGSLDPFGKPSLVIFLRMPKYISDLQFYMSDNLINTKEKSLVMSPLHTIFMCHQAVDQGLSLIRRYLLHNDIKIENFFVEDEYRIRLADFSKVLDLFGKYPPSQLPEYLSLSQKEKIKKFKEGYRADIRNLVSVVFVLWTGLRIKIKSDVDIPQIMTDYCGEKFEESTSRNKVIRFDAIDNFYMGKIQKLSPEEKEFNESINIFTKPKEMIHKLIFCETYKDSLKKILTISNDEKYIKVGEGVDVEAMYKDVMEELAETSKKAIDLYSALREYVWGNIKVKMNIIKSYLKKMNLDLSDKENINLEVKQIFEMLYDIHKFPLFGNFIQKVSALADTTDYERDLNFISDNAYLWSLNHLFVNGKIDKISEFMKSLPDSDNKSKMEELLTEVKGKFRSERKQTNFTVSNEFRLQFNATIDVRKYKILRTELRHLI